MVSAGCETIEEAIPATAPETKDTKSWVSTFSARDGLGRMDGLLKTMYICWKKVKHMITTRGAKTNIRREKSQNAFVFLFQWL